MNFNECQIAAIVRVATPMAAVTMMLLALA